MNTVQNSISEPRELGRLLLVYWRRWLCTAVLITAAAAAYALLAPKSWQSSQALIVRNEAAGNDADGARFHAPEELKGIEETILELSKSRGVLHAALLEVGPPADWGKRGQSPFVRSTQRAVPANGDCPRFPLWPSDADVENLQKAVKIVPPKGVEFGTSEVFYLEVRDKNRQRTIDLSTAICRQLQRELQEVRDAKARSMIGELEKGVQVASADLKAATARLTHFEQDVGSDLPELRSLLDANSTDTSLRRTVSEVENELRQCRAAEEANRQLLALLNDALADPTRLVAAPNRLLESQPALRRLKEGLVDAQLRTAMLQGRMSVDHPAVLSARAAEAQVAARLHTELSIAIRGVESELAVAESRLQSLQYQQKQAAARLDRLAGSRAAYANILSETSNRAKLLERAEQSLTNARSSSAGVQAANLITPVDSPDTGANPVSPSGVVIVLGGLLGGLLTGLGLVLLTAPAAIGKNTSSSTALAGPVGVSATVVVPYRTRERSTEMSAADNTEPWSLTATNRDGLTCAEALKLLNERREIGSSPL